MDTKTAQKIIRRAKDDITKTLAHVEEHEAEQSSAYWQGYLQQALKSLLANIGGGVMASAHERPNGRWIAMYRDHGRQKSVGTFGDKQTALRAAKHAEAVAKPSRNQDG